MRQAIRKHAVDAIAVLALMAVGTGVAAYILAQQGFRFPLIEPEPFELRAEIIDAGGVKPGQNQPVRIAFVRVGEIADVELVDGRAVLTLEIEPEFADRIREDATALIRPKTGLEDMFLDVDPGSEEAPPIEEGGLIPIGSTLSDVDAEQILNTLDRDARDYLELLVNGAGGGLEDRGDDLREALERLAPLHRHVADVAGALARRREQLERLVHDYGLLTARLARGDEDLERLVGASSEVFDALASQDADISLAVSRLPSALRETQRTLTAVDAFARELGPASESLIPAFQDLPEANAALTRLARETTGTIADDIRPFVRRAEPYLQNLRPAADRLASAMPDLEGAFGQLNRLFNMLAHNPGGAEPVAAEGRQEGYLYWLGWLAHNTNSLFSTSDASGPLRRANFLVSCGTLRSLAGEQPLLLLAGSVTELLADAQICPEGGG